MVRYPIVVLCLLILTPAGLAQTVGAVEAKPGAPATMLSYLATDMLVGVTSIEGTASVAMHVYGDDDFATAVATTRLGRLPLARDAAKTHPAIQRALDAYMTGNDLTEESAGRIRLVAPSRTVFGRIDAIGDDYVLLRLDDDAVVKPDFRFERRRIIAKSAIASIDLDANPVRFVTTPERTIPGTDR